MLLNVFITGLFVLSIILYIIYKESTELYDIKEATKKSYVITSLWPLKIEKQNFVYLDLVKNVNGSYYNNARKKKEIKVKFISV